MSQVYLWFKHDAYCCKRLKKLLFTFRETKTVFANKVLKWGDLYIFFHVESYNRNFNSHGKNRNEKFTTFQIRHANFKFIFIIWSFIFEQLFHMKKYFPLYKIPQAQLPVWQTDVTRQFKKNIFQSMAFPSLTGFKSNNVNVQCLGKLPTVFFPDFHIVTKSQRMD